MPKVSLSFTLIELLVVVAIIAVLIAILLPVISKARKTAQTVSCQVNVRNIWTAMRFYMDANNGFGPYYWNQYQSPAWWHQKLIKAKLISDYTSFDCPGAVNEGMSHSYGKNLGLVYGPNVCLYGYRNGSNIDVFTPKHIDNVERPSEKLGIVEGFNGGLIGDATRDNAESPWYVLMDTRLGDGTGSSYLTTRHDKKANVAFLDGHIEKDKDKFDAFPGTVWKYWRDDAHPNE